MILGITGTNGGGKGTVVDYLTTKGFTHYSVSGEIAKEVERRGLHPDRPTLGAVGNDLRAEHGAGYFIELFKARAAVSGAQDLVIESVRSLGEVVALHAAGGVLLAVDADRRIRYDRIVGRGSHKDKVDFETWRAQEEKEWHNQAAHDMDVPGVMALADFMIDNNGTLEELHGKVDRVLASLKGFDIFI